MNDGQTGQAEAPVEPSHTYILDTTTVVEPDLLERPERSPSRQPPPEHGLYYGQW